MDRPKLSSLEQNHFMIFFLTALWVHWVSRGVLAQGFLCVVVVMVNGAGAI